MEGIILIIMTRYLLCLGLSKITNHNELTNFLASVIHDTIRRRTKKPIKRVHSTSNLGIYGQVPS